jgi:hypothetical protein
MSTRPDTLGKYQIQVLLGKGKLEIIYLDLDFDRKVAITVLHPNPCEVETGQDFVRRLRREA